MSKTVTTVKVLVDVCDLRGESYDALLPLTIEIENGVLTLGSHNGPDIWRAKLAELTGGKDE